MILNLECPHCRQIFEADGIEKSVFCPHCGKEVFLKQAAAKVTPNMTAPQIKEFSARVQSIRGQAVVFLILAVILLILGVVMVAAAIFFGHISAQAGENQDANMVVVFIGSSLIVMAFWFYLIAQIIHIRANTHKE